jgi:hypothetical protein
MLGKNGERMNQDTKVKSATEAIRIAKSAAAEAGVMFPFVSGARKEGDHWTVEITSLAGSYVATISSSSGAVTEWKPAQTPSKR